MYLDGTRKLLYKCQSRPGTEARPQLSLARPSRARVTCRRSAALVFRNGRGARARRRTGRSAHSDADTERATRWVLSGGWAAMPSGVMSGGEVVMGLEWFTLTLLFVMCLCLVAPRFAFGFDDSCSDILPLLGDFCRYSHGSSGYRVAYGKKIVFGVYTRTQFDERIAGYVVVSVVYDSFLSLLYPEV